MAYPTSIIQKVLRLRNQGKTYGEIRFLLKRDIPKSTLSEWCKNAVLPKNYADRISALNVNNLNKARLIAHEINKIKREEFFKGLEKINIPVSEKMENPNIAKIALSMLCLGEARKYNLGRGTFSLGSSDPRIIVIFLELLKKCFAFDLEKVRCTVQCRTDQNIKKLEDFWMGITHIPKRLFYEARIDPRTVGKPIRNKGYKGVLRVDYFNTKVQLELESLSQLIYNFLIKRARSLPG